MGLAGHHVGSSQFLKHTFSTPGPLYVPLLLCDAPFPPLSLINIHSYFRPQPKSQTAEKLFWASLPLPQPRIRSRTWMQRPCQAPRCSFHKPHPPPQTPTTTAPAWPTSRNQCCTGYLFGECFSPHCGRQAR